MNVFTSCDLPSDDICCVFTVLSFDDISTSMYRVSNLSNLSGY